MRERGKSLSVWLVVSSFLLASPVAADMNIFPMWTVKQCPVEQFACYDMPQTKKILKIDLNLQLRLKEFEACLADRAGLRTAIEKRKEAAEKDLQRINRFRIRLEEKDKVLTTTTTELKKAESQSMFSWLPWIVGGTALIGVLSFVGGVLVGAR